MTIEEKIEKAVLESRDLLNYPNPAIHAINYLRGSWFGVTIIGTWHGVPVSLDEGIINRSSLISPSVQQKFTIIDKLIKEGDTTECLTSKSEYIRQCKKWYMENK